jgi:hypothetical protein
MARSDRPRATRLLPNSDSDLVVERQEDIMWTQLQLIPVGGAVRKRRSRAGLGMQAAICACSIGLMLPATTASSQTPDGSVQAVQPSAVRAAERHHVRPNTKGAPIDATVVVERPGIRATATAHNGTRRKTINRTAQAHLESQGSTLPTTSMICVDCDPAPPCGFRCGNSPIIDGAAIVVRR